MEEKELEYKCQSCGGWLKQSYLYCPLCGEYSTCSGMIETRDAED